MPGCENAFTSHVHFERLALLPPGIAAIWLSGSGGSKRLLPCLSAQQEAQKQISRTGGTGDVELADQASRGAEAADSETGPLLQQPGSDTHQISPTPSIIHLQPADKHKLQHSIDQQAVLQHNDDGALLTCKVLADSLQFDAATCPGLLPGKYPAHTSLQLLPCRAHEPIARMSKFKSASQVASQMYRMIMRQAMQCVVSSHQGQGIFAFHTICPRPAGLPAAGEQDCLALVSVSAIISSHAL